MINILGLAGSGKSTQGQLLAKYLNCPWISMSTLLTEYGDKQVRATMLAGRMVEDEVTLSILDDYLKSIGADNNEFVIDGWPRALSQAGWLADKVRNGEVMGTAVIHLKAHHKIAQERLTHRGRSDDTEESIARRFSDYKTTILPILDYLGSHGMKIIDIEADEPIDEVQKNIRKALGF